MFTEKQIALTPKVNGILKKLGWKWKPETGQFVIYKGKVGLIDDFCPRPKSIPVLSETGEFIPVLDWEDDIEPVLREAGYKLDVGYILHSITILSCEIIKQIGYPYNKCVSRIDACESRQQAVMEAVLDLGNSLK